jgi:hypothetical protein
MKSSWGIVIALCCALAALALVVHNVVRDAAPGTESEVARGERRAVDDRAAAGTRGGAGATIRNGPSNGAARTGSRTASGAGELSRRRLPEGLAGVASGGGGETERGGVGGGGDAAETAHEPRLSHHDLPPAGEPGAQNAAAGDDDSAPTPLPDVVYDGAGRVFDTESRVQVADAGAVTGNAGTISFWAKPEWDSGNPDHANFVQLGENGLRVVKDGNFLRFEYTDSSGDNALGGVADISAWQAGEWRYVSATWQGSTLSLYIDGQQVFLNSPGVPPFQSNPRLYVGSVEVTNGGPVAPAQLSYLTLVNRNLSSDEIRALFESGPPPGQ